MSITAKVVVKASTPKGAPVESDFRVEERVLPELKENELSFKSLYISPDPYQRGLLYSLKDGDIIRGSSVAEVIESKNSKFKPGDVIVPYGGWVTHGIVSGEEVSKLYKFEFSPVSTALGVLGMPGMTAYFGLLRICKPKEGDVVVVSGAAGAVGSLVGQIAKIKGATVIGVAGSEEKCKYLKTLGFDHTINYKTAKNLKEALDAAAPNGVDCFFDNVGGEIQDAVLKSLRPYARIAICGQISEYDRLDNPSLGPRLLANLIYKNATIKGFIVYRFASEWPEGLKQMNEWIKEGKVKYRETIDEGGIEATPRAFISLLAGGNMGKQLVKL